MTFLNYLGKFMISVGVGILLFVGWTIKGTDIYTAREQERLSRELGSLPRLAPAASGPVGPSSEFVAALEPGDPVFRLTIPAIDVSHIVVEGVNVEDLRKGPGHYPRCREGFTKPLCMDFPERWPGQEGRVIVSGHRTTYGAPFWGLDELRAGDEIITETKWGEFTYRVTEKAIVQPDDATIVTPSDDAELVLTTCNPRFSAAERLIVYAELVGS